MTAWGDLIMGSLRTVERERTLRAADPVLARHVLALKCWQHARFEASFADLLASPRFGKAAQFFLDDLYGPGDFTQRDQQFARVVPALARLFPDEVVKTVASLAELHALAEELDSEMGRGGGLLPIDPARYGAAWRRVGRAQDRERLVVVTLSVGSDLDSYTRRPLLRHSLRAMRGPARAAGLGALQSFLETGFEIFRAMRGASEFLELIARRERELAAGLFAGDDTMLANLGMAPSP